MDFGSYRVWYQKSGDTVWTAINNPVFTKVDNNILASWNTHGLTAGAYVLRLDMRDNLTDTVDAIKGVNLLPEILLSDGETMSENKISPAEEPCPCQCRRGSSIPPGCAGGRIARRTCQEWLPAIPETQRRF